MKKLSIPQGDHGKLVYFVKLQDSLKDKFYDVLDKAPRGLQPKSLINFISANMSELNEEQLTDLYSIYVNLSRSRESSGVSLPEYLKMLEDSLEDTGLPELFPNEQVISYFKKLLESGRDSQSTIKLFDSMNENSKVFLAAKIHQDLRPLFDDENLLVGSTVVHHLKITYRESSNDYDVYLSLDDIDLEKMIDEIKSAQSKSKLIKLHFGNANIMEIK